MKGWGGGGDGNLPQEGTQHRRTKVYSAVKDGPQWLWFSGQLFGVFKAQVAAEYWKRTERRLQ